MAGLLELVQGSAHDLRFLPDGSVHAVITSPPYMGLRSYAGDQDIDWPAVEYAPMAGLPVVVVPAQRCALGAEAEPFAYVGHLILCLREWWRVLRDDGVCLVNLGDSYASSTKGSGGCPPGSIMDSRPNSLQIAQKFKPIKIDIRSAGLKPKDLMMIPARFALAAQADGWYLRAGIVWAKGVSFLADYAGSSMPESVKDRPARSHEDIYLLAKRERYFWDYVAVREEAIDKEYITRGLVRASVDRYFAHDAEKGATRGGLHKQEGGRSTRNLRSVWVINPRPFSAAHFACWPETLVDPMIRAATSERGVCPACGAPWVRVVERGEEVAQRWAPGASVIDQVYDDQVGASSVLRTGTMAEIVTAGWVPSCGCSCVPGGTVRYDPVPAVVLDPFSGSATTGKVCAKLGRRYIGVDLASEYLGAVTDARMGDGVQMELV